MDQKFFIQPFAFAGDKTAIPDAVQPSGVVSFNQGYGFDYQRELGVDPDAKSIERDQMNWLFGAITENLAQYQRESIPEFITTANNGGAPFPYARGVMVRFRTGVNPFLTYVSKAAANTATPTEGASDANWELLIFERSSNAQALAGVDNNTVMTPLRVAEAIAASTVSVPAASETVAGIAEIATTAEVNTGTDNTRIVTPAKLAAYVPAASTTIVGKTRLATTAEAEAGVLATVAVTPAGLAAALAGQTVPSATETVAGIAEIATTAEVNTGTDNTRIVTPAKLAAYVPTASTTVVGKSRLATVAEATAGSLATVAVTPAGLSAAIAAAAVPSATESVAGILEIATTAEVTAGTDDARAVTPLKLAQYVPGATTTVAGKTRFATAAETTALTLFNIAISPGGLSPIMATKANLAGATFTGTIVAGDGLSFGSTLASSATDLSRHISIYAASGGFGFNLVSGAFNVIYGGIVRSNWSSTGYNVIGNCTATGGFQNGSSRLIKRDLRALPYGLADLEKIETCIGKYVEDIDPFGRDRLFVIAEQLAQVIAEPVTHDGLARADGTSVPTVEYSQLIPVIIEAIKELAGKIRKLEG